MTAPEPVECRFLILAERVAREAMDVAASAHNVSISELMAPGRCRSIVAHARQIAMYLAHVVGGMSLTEISNAFGRDRTTAAHACHAIEDRRESGAFDEQMAGLEGKLRARVAAIVQMQRARARPPLALPPFARRPRGGLTLRRGPRLKARSALRGRRRRP